jgi:hypothetical protein
MNNQPAEQAKPVHTVRKRKCRVLGTYPAWQLKKIDQGSLSIKMGKRQLTLGTPSSDHISAVLK